MLGPNYVVKGPFLVSEGLLKSIRDKAWEAAERFALIYDALDWRWYSYGRSYIPNAVDLHKQLMGMLDCVVERMAAKTERQLGEVVESGSTGGLHVQARWQDDEECDEVQEHPDFEFVFTDAPTVYVNSLGEVAE